MKNREHMPLIFLYLMTVILLFSLSACGKFNDAPDTETLRNDQVHTGGELFSIQTSTIYPADGGELINQAADEQDEDFRPELTSYIEKLDDYDVVFIGFPNWLTYHNLIQCTQA